MRDLLKMSSGINNLLSQCLSISPVAFRILTLMLLLYPLTGCISGKVKQDGFISTYQESLAAKGPQERTGTEGLAPISPAPNPRLPDLKEIKDPTGKTIINLTVEDALLRVLANSPEITVVSFDPSIAKDSLSAAASEFDITAFGQFGYDKNDVVSNNLSESGQSSSSLWEAGIKQKGITGAEWQLSYAMTRSVDESISRIFPTSYEPTVAFKLKQPLLRDAWPDLNLAGVDIAKLNYRIALASFLQKTEEVSTQLIALYWTLLQARRDIEIQQDLLNKAVETLRKVEDRKNIDATVGDIKQAESTVKSREAALLDAKKGFSDVQDSIVRLLSVQQMKLTDNLDIIPTTEPDTAASVLDQSELLKTALKHNPEIVRAQLETEVAEINVRVAKRQKMPRLDIVASTQLQGLSNDRGEAQDMISDGDYNSYSLGLIFEYPFGNRERESEFHLRKLRHAKARSKLQNVSDQVATQVKERIRFAETAHKKIQIQKDAVSAAKIHLQTLEDIETIREKLTPEFLLAKIQAQESVAEAQRSEVKAIVEYNIALAMLAQATGKVWDMRYIKNTRSFIASE